MKRMVLVLGLCLAGISFLGADPYTQSGQAAAETEARAAALATQEALAKIIPSRGLREIFIADWYTSLEIKEREVLSKDKKQATVRVTIYVNPITLNQAEQKYQSIAIRTLNEAETILSGMEEKTRQAELNEKNGQLEEAYLLYRQAEGSGQEVETLLGTFEGASFQSDQGYNSTAIRDRNKSLLALISQGLKRLEEYSQKVASSEQNQQLFAELQSQRDKLQKQVSALAQESPFRNASLRPKLEGYLVEVESSLELIQKQLESQLRDLHKAVPEEQFYFKNKVKLSLSEISRLENQLKQYRQELKVEIREPFIERQERLRRQAEFWRGVRTFLITHESKDMLALRYNFPPVLTHRGGGFQWEQPLSGQLRIEGSFEGFWIRALTQAEHRDLCSHDEDLFVITQELALALGGRRLLGAGFSWDWDRRLSGVTLPMHYSAGLFLVGQNEDRDRADWLLSARYQIPLKTETLVWRNVLNVDASFLIRLSRFATFEGGIRSQVLQAEPEPAEDLLTASDLSYNRDWRLGLGVRVPGPFLWIISYRNETSMALIEEAEEENCQIWQLSLEYSF